MNILTLPFPSHMFFPLLKNLQNFLILSTFLSLGFKVVHSTQVYVESSQRVLQKCPGSEIPEENSFLFIPKSIQEDFTKEQVVYNFTLISLVDPKETSIQNTKLRDLTSIAPSCLLSEKSYFSVELPFVKPPESAYQGFFDQRGILILVHETKRLEIYFHPKNYCINRILETGIEVHICKTPCANDPLLRGDEIPCFPKCCPIGKIMYYDATKEIQACLFLNKEDMNFPSVHKDFSKTSTSDESISESQIVPKIFPNFIWNGQEEDWKIWNCSASSKSKAEAEADSDSDLDSNNPKPASFYHVEFKKFSQKTIRLTKSGSIYNQLESWRSSPYEVLYDARAKSNHFENSYRPPICIEELKVYTFPDNVSQGILEPKYDFISGSCWANFKRLEEQRREDEKDFHEKTVIYPRIIFWIFLASAFVHLCTLSVYVVLWSQQNVHGWTVFTFTLCNFLLCLESAIQDGCQGYETFESSRLNVDFFPLCLFFGIGLHFLLVACFSWTAILSFDAWSTLRSMTATSRTYKGEKRFLAYCLVGFSFPFLWVLIAVLVEFNSDCEVQLCPGYSKYCSIFLNSAYYVYTLMPILVLFLLSMIFASLTVHFILSAKKNMTTLKSKDSRSTSKSHNNAKLAVKLFLMMGVLLIFEVVQSIHNPIVNSLGWVVLDFYRLFHALAIFWIFIGNARMLKNLGERLTIVRRFIEPATETTNGSQSTRRQEEEEKEEDAQKPLNTKRVQTFTTFQQ